MSETPLIPELPEALAEYAHTAWSGWMQYLFSKGERRGQFKLGSEGEIEIVWIMPAWAVERWQRQMQTAYSDLPESEKESDRAEADKMLEIISQFEQQLAEAGQWVPVPDGIYSADKGTDLESRWEVLGDGVEITDIVGDYVSVSLPDGWCIMRRVEPTEEVQP